MIQVEGAFSSQVLKFPNVTYTGEWMKRVVQYGTNWYYEWMLTTNGMLNFPTEVIADVTLIGGGGKGGSGAVNGTATYIGSGGGAGSPVYAIGKSFLGNSVVSLGNSGQDSLIYINGIPTIAAKGGNGVDATTSASASTHGSGFVGTYLAYGDPGYVLGETGNPATRNGTPGASVLGIIAGLSSANIGDALGYSGRGYGAGGGGGSAAPNGIAYAGMDGCRGVCLVRVRLNSCFLS